MSASCLGHAARNCQTEQKLYGDTRSFHASWSYHLWGSLRRHRPLFRLHPIQIKILAVSVGQYKRKNTFFQGNLHVGVIVAQLLLISKFFLCDLCKLSFAYLPLCLTGWINVSHRMCEQQSQKHFMWCCLEQLFCSLFLFCLFLIPLIFTDWASIFGCFHDVPDWSC